MGQCEVDNKNVLIVDLLNEKEDLILFDSYFILVCLGDVVVRGLEDSEIFVEGHEVTEQIAVSLFV